MPDDMSRVFETPPTQPFQFSGDVDGAVGQDVNLFRGAASFSVPLVSLKGRSGLNLDVAAVYNSSVSGQVGKTNRDAPTGVLGLGWELLLDRIDAEYGTPGNRDSAAFYLTSRGAKNRLYRIRSTWQRGSIDLSAAAALDQGTLDPAIVGALLQQSLMVDQAAVVAVLAVGQQWSITDPVNEYVLLVEKAATELLVLDGGDAYEPESFDFSQVRYYAPFERWEVTTTDGMTAVFGGGVGTDADGDRTSRGSSIVWGVKWNNWAGPSSAARDGSGQRLQSQYPVAWSLSSERAINRDEIVYSYQQTPQQVGSGGLAYGKARYLSQITDMYGRTVTFNYLPKTYSPNPAGVREYLDPYKAVPNDQPDAYQSRYETVYLGGIDCRNEQGTLLSSVKLGYDLGCFCAVPADAQPGFAGDMTKRVLTLIRVLTESGAGLPPMLFSYKAAGETNAGAIAAKVLPEGASVHYDYAQNNLTACSRSLHISPALVSAAPRVWFGPDYAVVLWVGQNRFSVAAYTWIGRWVEWQPAVSTITYQVNPDDIIATLQDGFFILDVGATSGLASNVLFYHKDNRILGGWLESPDSPVGLATTDRHTAAGDCFFAIADSHTNTVTRFAWDNTVRQWVKDSLPTPPQAQNPLTYRIFLAGASNILTALYYDILSAPGAKRSILALSYMDETRQWQGGGQRTASEITIVGPDPRKSFQWSASSWVFAATTVTTDNTAGQSYQLSFYTWGPGYQWEEPFQASYSVAKSAGGAVPFPITAQVSPTGMVSSGPHLLRYTGAAWLTNDNLKLQLPINDQTVFWFALGNDLVVKTENSAATILSMAQVFDPNTQVDAWTEAAISLYDGAPQQSRLSNYYPTAGQDYFSFDQSIYYRGTSSNWVSSVTSPAEMLPLGTNSTTLVNEAPEFLVYLKETSGDPVGTEILLLNDGFVTATEFVQQSFYRAVDASGKADPNPNGKFPGGAGSFVTFLPLNGSFDQAHSLTLYRFLNDSITQPILDYPVLTVTVDDGYIQKTYNYCFDAATAAVDSRGYLCKYYNVSFAVGDAAQQGTTRFTFINGVGNASPGNPTAPAVLDGQLLRKDVYDATGTLVASQGNSWVAVDTIQELQSGADRPLNGVYVQLTSTSSFLDGLETHQNFAYDGQTGQVSLTTTTVVNALCQQETHSKSVQPGYATYPLLGYLNVLSQHVETSASVAVADGAAVTIDQGAVEYDLYPGVQVGQSGQLQVLLPQRTRRRATAGTGSVHDAPGEWLMLSRAVLRNLYGYPGETVNSAGLIQSTLYSARSDLVVATFTGASLAGEEAYYYGFEPYESSGVWQPNYEATPLTTALCCTGSRCLSLPPGVTGTPLTLTPATTSQRFLFTFWATIDPAAAPSPTEAWRIDYESSGSSGPLPPSTTVSVTANEWGFYSVVIDLSTQTAPVTVRFTPMNGGASTVFVDNVCFSTLAGSARIKVYDTTQYLLTAEVGPYDQIRHRVYDRLHRQVALTNEFQSVTNLVAPYLSRQTGAPFDAAAPNSQLAAQPMGDTFYERFLNNGVWSDHFTSATSTLWASAGGRLSYSGTGPGSIAFTRPAFTSDYLVRCEVEPLASPPAAAGLSIGEQVVISWDPSGGSWRLVDSLNGVTVPCPFTSSDPGGDWLAILSTDAIIFAINGAVLFQYLPARMPSGAPAITANGPLAVSGFIIAAKPQLAIRYFDACGRVLQGQSIEGARTVVSAVLRDELATSVIRIKPVGYDGRSLGLIAFRGDVVQSFDWTTGVMTGKAADEYPDDEGYPYVRTLLEASPLRRRIEIGAPGKPFAITDLSTTTPADRHTVRYGYGANAAGPVSLALGWQAGQFAQVTTTDQDGRVTLGFNDSLGRPAATANLLDPTTQSYLLSTQYQAYTAPGSQRMVRLPSYYAPPAGSTAEDWVNVVGYDLLGRRTSATTPDSGTTRKIYNSVGQTRFEQDALAAQRGVIVYSKYDLYSRCTESGLIAASWDDAVLQPLADTPEWPTAADGARVVRQLTYDGEGSDVNALGRMSSASDYDESTRALVSTTRYTYDDRGQVKILGLTLGDGQESYETGYTYDNLGNVASTTYATGLTLVANRDPVGRVASLTDGGPQLLAAYTYRNDDEVGQQAILPGTTAATTIAYGYNSPGWLESVSSAYMIEKVSFTSGSYDGTPSYSGLIGATGTCFTLLGETGGFPSLLNYAYQYDSLGRLQVAQATVSGEPQAAWSFGLARSATYDPNGNFLTVDDGGEFEDYRYTVGTNQVINTTGSAQIDYPVNAVGAVTGAAPQGITGIDYMLTTGRATKIRTGSRGDVALSYDSASNRVVKTSGTTTRVYVRGVNGWPLVEYDRSGNTVTAVTEYLYGPQGLFAIRVNQQIYPLLTDHLRSVRGLVGADGGLLVALHYSPFGRVIAAFGSSDLLRYRFTGYELDPETGLYNAAARLYDPNLKRFYSVDPRSQFHSPYVYGGNNPLSMLDPTGEAAWWALLVGAVVGVAAGIVTAGAGAAVFGGADAVAFGAGEGLSLGGVSTAISAVSGAVGSVAGDATSAGLSGQKFTGQRALLDVFAGAAAGGVGEFVGGRAAAGVMRLAAGSLGPKAVTALGSAVSGVVGGTAGSAAAGGVASAMTGQSFFSTGNALNIAIGAAIGFGGALLGSGAALGWGGKTMPVPLGRKDFGLLQHAEREVNGPTLGETYKLITFNPDELHLMPDGIHHLNMRNARLFDVIDVHGSGRFVFPTIKGAYRRPLSNQLFSEYITNRLPTWVGGGNRPPVKLSICYGAAGGAKSLGQTLATALQRNTLGVRGTVSPVTGAPANEWVRFH